jgi:hypothetical protein
MPMNGSSHFHIIVRVALQAADQQMQSSLPPSLQVTELKSTGY